MKLRALLLGLCAGCAPGIYYPDLADTDLPGNEVLEVCARKDRGNTGELTVTVDLYQDYVSVYRVDERCNEIHLGNTYNSDTWEVGTHEAFTIRHRGDTGILWANFAYPKGEKAFTYEAKAP